MSFGFAGRVLLCARADSVAIVIEYYGGDYYASCDDSFCGFFCSHLTQARFENCYDQDSEEGTDYRASTTHEAGSSDKGNRDGLQLDANGCTRPVPSAC